MRKHRAGSVWMILPLYLFTLIFVALPLLYVAALSFSTADGGYGVNWKFTLDNYKQILEPVYLQTFTGSFRLALTSTLIICLVGYPFGYFMAKLSEGKNVILEIEIQGAMKIKEKIPEAVLIFVTPPSVDELRRRLEGRGTETQEVIESRLSRAAEEAEGMEDYDYLLVNDDLEECVNELHRIISSERCKTQRNTEFINRIQEESRGLMKGDL